MGNEIKVDLARRDLLKAGLAGGALALLGGVDILAEGLDSKTQVWTVTGKDKAKLMAKAMEIIQSNGGFGKSVNTLALKVNAAWSRTPEQGANTHPELVGAFLDGCRQYGIAKVSIPEFSCDSPKESFVKSGIYEAVSSKGFTLTAISHSSKSFAPVDIPKGRSLKKAEVVDDFLNSDAVVNMPVAKSHGASGVSMAMKNWMGSVKDRGWWHNNGIPQCIADFATLVKPTWTIIDATRVMMDSGPKGPSRNMKTPNMLIISKDQVAADAYATQLFWGSIKKASFLGIAEEMGIGTADVSKMDVRSFEV